MPVLDPKYDHVKVYRPKGTRTAVGEEPLIGVRSSFAEMYTFGFAADRAIQKAITAFHEEHKRIPWSSGLIVEILSEGGMIRATVIELPEEANWS
jgi:hypothetical protein